MNQILNQSQNLPLMMKLQMTIIQVEVEVE
jgi:hypothetical protein